MRPPTLPLGTALLLLAGCTSVPQAGSAYLRDEVTKAERAFAASMASRDHEAFQSFLSPEAVFIAKTGPLRGAERVAASWKRFFLTPQAPFSWEPEVVEVLPSGTLALTSGPVRDPTGRLIGTFTSIWRRQGPGTWRIVFDKGCSAAASTS